MSEKDFEEYWEQTRRKWARHVADPYGAAEGCGFCRFAGKYTCEVCPVVKVYGVICASVEVVAAYMHHRWLCASAKELSVLAEAVVQELDDKKDELIAAMRELWEEANEDSL